MGSFSKTFASNGGFLAMKSEAVKQYVKYYGASHTFSNALSPVQTAVVLKAIQIIRSPEGELLTKQTHEGHQDTPCVSSLLEARSAWRALSNSSRAGGS